MHRKDINERSPLRVLDESIHGGLGRGKLGVVMARTGVGKTAFLVGVALDDLMRGRNVLHVALDQSVEKVHAFYEEVFQDLAREKQLEDVWKVRIDLERHRRIHAYSPPAFSAGRLRDSVGFMRDHTDFVPSTIIVDGFDFTQATMELLTELRELAREADAELWMSAITTRDAERDGRGIPEPVAGLEDGIDVILSMAHDGNGVHIGLHKDHDNPDVSDLKLALDPTTMLLVREGTE